MNRMQNGADTALPSELEARSGPEMGAGLLGCCGKGGNATTARVTRLPAHRRGVAEPINGQLNLGRLK